jgi:hypothetical protein
LDSTPPLDMLPLLLLLLLRPLLLLLTLAQSPTNT